MSALPTSPTKATDKMSELDPKAIMTPGSPPFLQSHSRTLTRSSTYNRFPTLGSFRHSYSQLNTLSQNLDHHTPYKLRTSRVIGLAEKPWLQNFAGIRDRLAHYSLYAAILLAILGSAGFAYKGYSGVIQHKYCLVMDDSFANLNNWELQTRFSAAGGIAGGVDSYSFELTTAEQDNVQVKDGKLYISPTINTGQPAVLNLTANGDCIYRGSSTTYADPCYEATNATISEMVTPFQTAQLRSKVGLLYGRLEVKAKLPLGEYLMPEIFLMPSSPIYGADYSGKINVMRTSGTRDENDPFYNTVASGFTFRPDFILNNTKSKTRSTFAEQFTTFGFMWDATGFYTYIDSPRNQIMYASLEEPIWVKYPELDSYGQPYDYWANGTNAAPFDQIFDVYLGLGVGGDFFTAYQSDDPPWTLTGTRVSQLTNFWSRRASWLPSWSSNEPDSSSFIIESVKMWQQC